MKRNASIPFAFRSFIRTLASPKILALGNEKKCKHSFCISLVYSYSGFAEDTITRK